MSAATLPASPAAAAQSQVAALRLAAKAAAQGLAAPTVHDEAWRFTSLAALYRMPEQAGAAQKSLAPDALAAWVLPEAGHRMVFVDGVFAPQWGCNDASQPVTVCTLAQALDSHPAVVARHLGRYATDAGQYFTASNTAALTDVAVVIVHRHAAVARPVHMLFVATQPNTTRCVRVLVIAEAGSALTLVEDYVSTTDQAYLTNCVAELAIAEQAQVQHIRLQRESVLAFHVGRCAVSQAASSRYHSIQLALGAEISRLDATVVQQGEGAHTVLDGLAYIGGQQLADTHTCITHAQAHGGSRQLHKCIVADSAQAVFNGRVQVRPLAQKTDSAQSSRTLLLGPKAQVNTLPQLEINADDVRCTHGATVGQLNQEEVFYLQSRGLSAQSARSLLTYGFAAEIITRMPVPSLRQGLQDVLQLGVLV